MSSFIQVLAQAELMYGGESQNVVASRECGVGTGWEEAWPNFQGPGDALS